MTLAQTDIPAGIALWLAGGFAVLLVVGIVFGPLIGRLIRHGSLRDGPPVVWDGTGDPWDRNTDGTYRLRATNSDGHLQSMSLDDIEQAFGSVSLDPPAGQDPTP